jgi:cytochrome b
MTSSSIAKIKILVWDAPTRVFHWLMAFCFAVAYATSEGHGVAGIHVTLGYTMVGLVVFRLVWGVMGTRYARFTGFVRGPETVVNYATEMLSPKAENPVGHNPLGGVSIVLMLLTTMAIAYTGWIYLNGGSHSLKELHEGAAGFMAAIVGLHVAGVVFASMMQGENLTAAMFNGRKRGRSEQGIAWSWWPVALVLLCCVLGFWLLQAQNPSVGAVGGNGKHDHRVSRSGDDD